MRERHRQWNVLPGKWHQRSAADDAAGLAVANKMESQQRGTRVGLRNSKDAISLAKTAEGAMMKVTHLMFCIRELACKWINLSALYTSKDEIMRRWKSMLLSLKLTR